jgi:cytoskeletal protein CcmA (bactofilin family)
MSDAPRNKTVLGPDCRISGELALDNDAMIMGQFQGTLRVSGMLELAESSEVQGTIIVGTLRLAGRVEADVVAEEGVELLPGAQLKGQLFTSRLNVVEGATFQGDICVGPKAMEAASEALGQEEAEETSALSSIMPQADEPQEQAAPQVKTNASSVSAVLQRRRPKVLSPRNGATAHS